MPTEIRMPRLTETMTEGTLVAWRRREGDPVRAGEVIAEIQVDKTTVDLESPEDGTVARIVTPAGANSVEPGAVLAVLLRPDETSASASPPEGNGVPAQAEGHAREAAEAVLTATAVENGASPLARYLAAQIGVDLTLVRGGGPGGRVMMADVLTSLGAAEGSEAAAPPSPGVTASVPDPGDVPYEDVPNSPVRLVVARRLGASKREVPHFYLAKHCEVDALLKLRAELQGRCDGGQKLSINDFLIRATALALRKVPEVNASWTDAATRRYRRVDIAVAVATDAGLITPVVRGANCKGVAEIAAEIRDLAARARAGRLRPEEYQGGTFTVSNLGMHGVDEIYAIVNPPQAALLGLGAAGPRPVARDGAVVVATVMTCTLSADHRVLDGSTAARFLSAFATLVGQPLTMLL